MKYKPLAVFSFGERQGFAPFLYVPCSFLKTSFSDRQKKYMKNFKFWGHNQMFS